MRVRDLQRAGIIKRQRQRERKRRRMKAGLQALPQAFVCFKIS
jgi:hypothetical protein